MLLSVPPRTGFNPYNGYTSRLSKKVNLSPGAEKQPTPSSQAAGRPGVVRRDALPKLCLVPRNPDHPSTFVFYRYGKIVSTKAILDKTTNTCKGYGFVDFDSPSAAQKAVTALKAGGVQAQMAKVRSLLLPNSSPAYEFNPVPPPFSLLPPQQQDPTNLYISNLPQELENMLKPFSQVISTRILRDANGTSRGVGFARLSRSLNPLPLLHNTVPLEPLLCKFADGGQKKRQSQGKYLQHGRPWTRDGETGGMTLTYDPTTALQNGFYSAPYSMAPNRMIAQTSLPPYMHSPVNTYQVRTGQLLTQGMEHTMSIQPTSMMGPPTQQLSHLSMGSSGTYMPANTSMQGTYIPQYTQVPQSNVSVEELAVLQQVALETPTEHPDYSYQHSK
uniref:RRM domain-containing protein n=1 Tax=Oncorhynchus tshawytscha TaxID=74940 RepID=A0AAZ3QEJ3_ONCTS